MSETAHTPGPWRVDSRMDRAEIVGRPSWPCTRFGVPGEWRIAVIDDLSDDEPTAAAETEANARLISAAPDMLEALADCVSVLTDPVVGTVRHDDPDWYRALDKAVAKARAAIAKATGEAS